MWVRKTPEEVARWDDRTRRSARRHGLAFAGAVLVVGTVISAAGLRFTRMGVILREVAGGFWTRLLFAAGIMAPLSYWIYGHEMENELAKAHLATICPTCDVAGDGNAGEPCGCGDVFVPLREMKWVEDS